MNADQWITYLAGVSPRSAMATLAHRAAARWGAEGITALAALAASVGAREPHDLTGRLSRHARRLNKAHVPPPEGQSYWTAFSAGLAAIDAAGKPSETGVPAAQGETAPREDMSAVLAALMGE